MNSCLANHSDRKNAAIAPLRAVSAHLGRNPLYVQANNGNTSLKLGESLWIKASGKWLAEAEAEEIFVEIPIDEVARCLCQNTSVACAPEWSVRLRPSIETAMHAVLPYRVVIHVHSVNTIAWAIRDDAPARLCERLAGLAWGWVPYVSSGIPLARAIQTTLAQSPGAEIFILGNHGLVVCGENCDAALRNLSEVEHRLGVPPRPAPAPDTATLQKAARSADWRVPDDEQLHALGTDPHSRRILENGILYPCQAVFLGQSVPVLPKHSLPSHGSEFLEAGAPFLLVEDAGILVHPEITGLEKAMLAGLVEVVQRTESTAPIRYLTLQETLDLLNEDVYGQREPVPETAMLRS